MPWKIVERKIGRAGGIKRRLAKQREWDQKYEDWAIGYVVDGEFVSQDDALDSIYHQSYARHFENNPADLEALIQLAKILRNPHAEATTGVDLQVPATYDGKYSHPISVRLSPLTIECCVKPKMTLESYWQEKKCFAVYVE